MPISISAYGGAFQTGMIVLWSGTIATIPSGWHLCDGAAGTPNLTNQMIICASVDDAGVPKASLGGTLYSTGGSHLATGQTDVEYASVSDLGHTHTLSTSNIYDGTAASSATDTNVSDTGYASVSDAGHHHHVSNVGVMNPFYALAYIMKL